MGSQSSFVFQCISTCQDMRPIRWLGAVFQCTSLFPTPPPVDSLRFCPLVSGRDRLCRLKCLCAFRRVGCENQSAEASRGTQVRYRNGQGPNSLQDRRLGRSTPSRHRSGRNCRSGVASRCAAWSRKHRKHSSRSDGVPNGNREEVRTLAIMGGAARSSRASLAVSGEVTPVHAVTAASMFGKALRRSSPTATALTRELHRGLAVRLAEGNFSTAPAVARAGAPSPSAPQR